MNAIELLASWPIDKEELALKVLEAVTPVGCPREIARRLQ
jgi:hypothetical protein